MVDLKESMTLERATSKGDTENGVVIETPDPAVVKAYLRRCDLFLIPILSWIYLLNALDRSNLGNAHTAGINKDLGMNDKQYNMVLTFYYVPFVLFGPLGSVVSKIISARYALSGMMVGFGIASMCAGAVKNYGGLFACRFFVGLFEAGFLASVVVYLSGFYTRREIASRIGLFYAAHAIAAAFGGLLAYGVFQIKSGPLHPWAYLFLLEGGLTVLSAVASFFILPKDLQRAYFLTQEQKEVAMRRMLADSLSSEDTKFVWGDAIQEFKGIHIYIRIVIIFTFGVLIGTNSNFLPIIVRRLGYSVVKTNLYTVAPSVTSAITLLGFCLSSDHFRERGLHMCIILTIAIVAYILLMTLDLQHQKGLTYFAVFLTAISAYPMSVIFSAWTVCNMTNMSARALGLGVLIALGNSAGFVSSNIFFDREAPRYMTALKVNCIMASVSLVSCFAYTMWMRFENKRRDRVYGKPEQYVTVGISDPRDHGFRFQP